MERLTNRLNDKAYLKCSCPDGEYFQKLIDKLAEYEDLDDKGLIKRPINSMSVRESEVNGKETIDILLNQIVTLTQDNTDFDVKTVLSAYCEERHLKEDYDGLFWSNEGATWEYRNNLDVVKLVDTYFVTYRKLCYPEIKHKNFGIHLGGDDWRRSKYPCRYDYLKNKEEIEY